MERRVGLLSELGRAGLPFAVPAPLSEVAVVDGYAAVALSWVPGQPGRGGDGGPAALRELLAALCQVDIGALGGVLAPPHGYARGEQWAELMAQAITRPPPDVRGEARLRLDEALALPAVPPSLVHGDLAGANLRWTPDGRLLGVLDWDWASAWARPSMPPASAGTTGQPFSPLWTRTPAIGRWSGSAPSALSGSSVRGSARRAVLTSSSAPPHGCAGASTGPDRRPRR
jgi:Phosphotransferase enzyme family